jgi:hypothetical protein
MIRLGLLFLFLTSVSLQVVANQVEDTVYINRGLFTTIQGSQFDYLAFNSSTLFSNENSRFVVSLNDTLVLTVINNDSIQHGFSVKNTSINFNLAVGGMNIFSFSQSSATPFVYFDPLDENTYLGLAGIIVFTDFSKNFFWNMKDHQASWNDSISAGGSVNWNDYYPNYFTINGKSNPDINLDTNARVTGNVGDTMYIYMANTGHSIHSIHFHGYHAEIIFSSENSMHVGRSKDTFPIQPMEISVVRLVPNQPGEYPVHDHNLVAVSGGNYYPNGMFLTMLIN